MTVPHPFIVGRSGLCAVCIDLEGHPIHAAPLDPAAVREAAAWAASFIRCECIDETEAGTARTLAVLDRLAKS